MTLVEYVLFVSGFVLVAVTAVGGLNSTARSYFQQSSSKIGQPVNRVKYDQNGNRQQQASTTTITAPPSTTTTAAPTTTRATTTVPPTTVPPTTVAPTTAPPTTTTTLPPTTTTLPPTTTTTIAKRVSTSIVNGSTNGLNSTWNLKITVTVSPIGGATVSGLTVNADGKYAGSTIGSLSCVTNTSGVCVMTYNGVPDSYSPIVMQITSVSGTAPWTGTTASLTITAP